MKGISKIIATVLILLIVIALAGSSWLFFSGLFKSTMSTEEVSFEEVTKRMQGCLRIESINPTNGNITLRNCGPVTLSKFNVFVDDSLIKSDSRTLDSGGIMNINVDLTEGSHDIFVIADYATSLGKTVNYVGSTQEICQVFINFLPYNITQNNTYYCLNTSSTDLATTAIQFGNSSSWAIQNSVLDCQGYSIGGNDVSDTYGVYLTGSNTKNNTVKNCYITNFDHGICLNNGPKNTTLTNNTAKNSYFGIKLYGDGTSNNTIADGSIHSNTFDYGVENYLDGTNTFTSTNFTGTRIIYFGPDCSDCWFNYRNDTASSIWLKTMIPCGSESASTMERKLTNWSQDLMQWNDTSDGIFYYNITGLKPNKYYSIYNSSQLVYALKTDADGNLPSFNISLSGYEMEIKVEKDTTTTNVTLDSSSIIIDDDSQNAENSVTGYIDDIIDGGVSYGDYATMWNISSLPIGITINDAEHCMYVGTKYNDDNNEIISAWGVQNYSWTATPRNVWSNITNPNHGTNFANQTIPNAIGWWCFNITTWVISEYNDGKKNFTVDYIVEYDADGYDDYIIVQSAEGTNKPYLNITYSNAD